MNPRVVLSAVSLYASKTADGEGLGVTLQDAILFSTSLLAIVIPGARPGRLSAQAVCNG